MRHFTIPVAGLLLAALPGTAMSQSDAITEYLKRLPYQETFDYMMQYTGGDPENLNKWVAPAEPVLLKAGEDKIVRSNNDTFYKSAFVDLTAGPVTLIASVADPDRFSSFQLMDDRNVNFRNIIRPDGRYVLYHGEAPTDSEGELVEAPSELMFVLVRVEVKDPGDAQDVAKAEAVYRGIEISGPEIEAIEPLDLLSEFDPEVAEAAEAQMEETLRTTPVKDMVAGPGDVPDKVSYLELATLSKHGWGGPVSSHSAYEIILADANGDPMIGADGPYKLTTEEPPVGAFWSVTVYESSTGRLFNNPADRYHINNTMAVKNDDGTVTFLFKTECTDSDVNCLYVPASAFDITARYYLPDEAIQAGEWTMPRPEKAGGAQ